MLLGSRLLVRAKHLDRRTNKPFIACSREGTRILSGEYLPRDYSKKHPRAISSLPNRNQILGHTHCANMCPNTYNFLIPTAKSNIRMHSPPSETDGGRLFPNICLPQDTAAARQPLWNARKGQAIIASGTFPPLPPQGRACMQSLPRLGKQGRTKILACAPMPPGMRLDTFSILKSQVSEPQISSNG